MAVHEPPLGVPFVDSSLYVAKPWVEWLILSRTNFVNIEDNIDEIEIDVEQIAANTAAISANTADIVDLEAADVILTNSILSNEALSFYFASL